MNEDTQYTYVLCDKATGKPVADHKGSVYAFTNERLAKAAKKSGKFVDVVVRQFEYYPKGTCYGCEFANI